MPPTNPQLRADVSERMAGAMRMEICVEYGKVETILVWIGEMAGYGQLLARPPSCCPPDHALPTKRPKGSRVWSCRLGANFPRRPHDTVVDPSLAGNIP